MGQLGSVSRTVEGNSPGNILRSLVTRLCRNTESLSRCICLERDWERACVLEVKARQFLPLDTSTLP